MGGPSLQSAALLLFSAVALADTLTCPKSDQATYTAASGDTYHVNCGVDYFGGDLSAVYTDTFNDCLEKCDITAGCLGVAYNGNYCYMKSVINNAVTNAAVWGAIKQAAGLPSASHECPESDGSQVVTPNGNTFTIQCGADHFGGDLRSLVTDSFDDCLLVCDSTPDCVSISFRAPNCYIKNTLTPSRTDAGVWGAVLTKLADSSVGSNKGDSHLTCPGADGTIITKGTTQFLIQCGIDHYGGDLSSEYTQTFEACIEACAANPACLTLTYAGPEPGWCYMKNVVTDNIRNAGNAWGAMAIPGSPTGGSASSVSSQPSSATPSTVATAACPAADGISFTEGGKTFLVQCSTDHYGGDLTNQYTQTFDQCLLTCALTRGCIAVSFSGPGPAYCYMKDTITQDTRQNGAVWGAVLASGNSPSVSTTSSVPSSSLTSSTSSIASTSMSSLTDTSSVPTLSVSSSSSLSSSSASSSSSITTLSSTASTTTSTTTSTTASSSTMPSDGSTVQFTGVNVAAQASPATCPTLPAPTADLVSVPIGGTDPGDSYLQDLFFTPDTQQLLYMSAVGDDGNLYIIDLTRTNEICIFDTNGNSICINGDGVQLSPADCSASIDISIADFANQLASMSGTSGQPQRRSLEKRFVELPFFVTVQLTNQCQNPVTDLTPSLTVGPTACHLAPGVGNGVFTFGCNFPGENSKEMQCENTVNDVLLGTIAGGIIGSSTNWGTVGGLLKKGIGKYISGEALLAALETAGIALTAPAWLVTVVTVASTGIAILAAVEVALALYQHFSPNGIAQDVCMVFNAKEFPLPLTLTAGSSTEVFANLAATDKPADMSKSAVVNDPGDQSCQTCTNGGTCGTYGPCGTTGGDCACGISTEGVNFCALDDLCVNLAQCGGSATCGPGYLCLSGNCCGYNVCIRADSCGAPAPNRFKPRGNMPYLARSNSSIGGLTPFGWRDGLVS